jgi:hypothetical protein
LKSEDRRNALAEEIERHIDAEDAILKEYHVLVDQLPEGPLSILINQVTTEEEMHHFLLSTLVDWLRREVDSERGGSLPEADRAAIADRARLLQDHEQATIDACSELKQSLGAESDELIEALLDVLILDSRKHHRLLSALDRLASD